MLQSRTERSTPPKRSTPLHQFANVFENDESRCHKAIVDDDWILSMNHFDWSCTSTLVLLSPPKIKRNGGNISSILSRRILKARRQRVLTEI
jgi:hypothetical protein